ncbi:MAG: hypothetical protein Q4P78_01390 [Rothia sp. (in: high G+C Gram-positive bacteria)]|uniref:hypothetical protein n=1 Tax=Rothia sp. (in: high G+C Gram-positive bacteria) TaxID=1885016 RepID=UPI0026DF02FC|nr:hypothetical protein [Rothia sp. (in: high G+C Gram-positive bacteria)]MDO5749838.1 hypothetical protein [Rothia sp. (in: high G+C Gram-positive bacteria)]
MSQDNFSSPNNQQPQQIPVYYPQQVPEKKSKPWLWALGGGCAGMALLFAGCSALVIGASASSSSSKASASASKSVVAASAPAQANVSAAAPAAPKQENVQTPVAKQETTPAKTRITTPSTYQVELLVTSNGDADVSHGTLSTHSSEDFSSEWSKTIELPRHEYYSLSASTGFSLNERATSVSCTIKVDGEVVDHQEATGDYASAHCSLSSWYSPKKKK